MLQRYAMDDRNLHGREEPDYEERREREAAQFQALTHLRHECFYGAAAVGAAAGMLEAWYGLSGFMAMIYGGIGGVVMVMIAGFTGGFCASVLRSALARIQGLLSLDEEGGGEGPVIGGFGGAFLGLLIALIAWDIPSARLYTGIGTAIGSFIGGLPGEHVGVFIRMLALQEHLERCEQEKETEGCPTDEASGHKKTDSGPGGNDAE